MAVITKNAPTITTVAKGPKRGSDLDVSYSEIVAAIPNRELPRAERMQAAEDLVEVWKKRHQAATRTLATATTTNTTWLSRHHQVVWLTQNLLEKAEKVYKKALAGVLSEELKNYLVPNDVTKKSYMGILQAIDMYDLFMIPKFQPGSNNRPSYGAKYHLQQDYGLIEPDDDGFLLTLNGEEHILSGEDVYQLMTIMDSESYQALPFDNAGVFANNGNKANYNGVTFIVNNVRIIDTNGVTIDLEKIRIIMEYKVSKVMYYALLPGQNPEASYPDYKALNDAVTWIFGRPDYIPGNRFAFEHLWQGLNISTQKVQGEDRYIKKSQALIDKAFEIGQPINLYYHIDTKNDFFNPEKFKAGMLRGEAERAAERENQQRNQQETHTGKSQRAGRSTGASPEIPIETDDCPF